MWVTVGFLQGSPERLDALTPALEVMVALREIACNLGSIGVRLMYDCRRLGVL